VVDLQREGFGIRPVSDGVVECRFTITEEELTEEEP